MAALNYAEAGVDIQAADQLVDRIASMAKKTLGKRVKASVGGYASLYEIDRKRWLAASTDGVGTKLKLAFRLNRHDTIGIDLVAMSVNDVLCVGAEPLFFLDYFATGKLLPGVAEKVLAGIVEGCRQAGCALVGGETAEMPDFYAVGEYDLGGFVVGQVEPKRVLPRKDVKPGDVLIGLGSSGFHSTGYSLLRRLIPDGPDGDPIARELLTPTRIYTRAMLPLLREGALKGAAHITGSGFLNVPRMSEKLSYEITLPAERPAAFRWLEQRAQQLPLEETGKTFNLGVGMVLAVSPSKEAAVLRKLKRAGEKACVIGSVVKKRSGRPSEVHLRDGERSATLAY